MCGRYVLTKPGAVVSAHFELFENTPDRIRYNCAPTQLLPIVRVKGEGPSRRELVALRWGLVPRWADSPSIGLKMINARSESVASKPAFRDAFRHRRCLVPSDGFFEWAHRDRGRPQPYLIGLKGRELLAYAGIWESWEGEEGKPIESFSILTTPANDLVRPIHDRMPLILPRESYGIWLDAEVSDPEALRPLLRPFPADQMELVKVSQKVNRVGYEEPDAVEPLEEQDGEQLDLF